MSRAQARRGEPDRLDAATLSRGFRAVIAPYASYRRGALKLKAGLYLSFIFLCNSAAWASGFTIDKISGLYRLKGPSQPVPSILTAQTPHQGGGCKGKATVDLVLRFATSPTSWLEGMPTNPAGPCDISASPLADGFEIRISYATDPKASDSEIRSLVFATPTGFVVDHWIERTSAAEKKKKTAAAKKPQKKNKASAKASPLTALPEGATLLTAFDDQGSWEKLLGAGAQPLDLNTRDFDRFRARVPPGVVESPKELTKRLPLMIPILEPGPADTGLIFSEEPFPFQEFAHEHGATPELKAATDGMNFVRVLAKDNQWLKAQSSISILEKSPFGKKIPNDARWWALKGLVHIKLADVLHEKAMARAGLNFWREGLRRTAGLGGVHREAAEYMALESVRTLLDEQLDYGAASLLTWLQRYSWSDRGEERFGFLRAEVLMRLGLFADAEKLFNEFVNSRAGVPLSGQVDRRLVPAAAFRLGDIAFRERRFADSVSEYTKALGQLEGPNKFSFEGTWYPEDLRVFPHVLLNRASASMRQGLFAAALRDLRGFIYIVPTDYRVGWAYFLIGDLLLRAGDVEKAVSTWRECAFQVPDSTGARLCSARLTAHNLPKESRERWPRLIASIEDALPGRLKNPPELVSPSDLEGYVGLVLADAFLRSDEPTQALMRLDSLRHTELAPRLSAWKDEYLVTSLTGSLLRKGKDKKYKEVVADYGKRRTTLFLQEIRPDVLYPVALAHRGLGLWTAARETLDVADKLRSKSGILAPRPYRPTDSEWSELRANVEVELFQAGQIDEKTVRQTLLTLGQTEAADREWIRFDRKKGDLVGEAARWANLAKTSALPWPDVRRYSTVLKLLERTEDRRRFIESRVGAWFTERQKPAAGTSPGPDLLVELFDVREASKDFAGALVVTEHLLTLSDKELGSDVTKPMVAYRRGQILRRLGRFDDARASFIKSRTMDPSGLWGSLSAAAEREMGSGRSL